MTDAPLDQPCRPRRNRRTPALRAMVRETHLTPSDLIAPLFVHEGDGRQPIASMPGQARLDLPSLIAEAQELHALGVPAVAIFPALGDDRKDRTATESTRADGLYQRAIRALKDALPDLCVVTDVAMDPYSSDGHDGLVVDGVIVNDPTLEILAAMAVSQARAGADVIAPSDMMDGRVGAIRTALDAAGFSDVAILSYTAKYASAFYGPFREALDSAPRAGDKKTYQMDPANARESLREATLDELEGADMLMVKPALPYLDVILRLKEHSQLPIAAYQVSGEYAMVQAVAANGWMDGQALMLETTTAIKRAGADVILTYFAKELARRLA